MASTAITNTINGRQILVELHSQSHHIEAALLKVVDVLAQLGVVHL